MVHFQVKTSNDFSISLAQCVCVYALAIFVIIPDNGVYMCVWYIWYMHTHHSALVGWKLNCKNYYWNKTAYKKSHSECKCILWKWFERHPMSKKPTTVSITIYNAMATKKMNWRKEHGTHYSCFSCMKDQPNRCMRV